MNTIRDRAKEQLPMVLLTLLSIVQALALELLWGHVTNDPYLFRASWEAVIGWSEIAATFLGILLIWLIYGSTVMRFRWVPSTADSVFPFLVGIVEFTLIELLGPERLGQWFLTMAVIFALMTWVTHLAYTAARRDHDNAEYFGRLKPATWRDFVPATVNVATLTALGLVFLLSGHAGWGALLAVLVVIGGLAYQTFLTDYYWRLSMTGS